MERIVEKCLLAVLLTACQNYEPQPLNPEQHRAAWHTRTLAESSVAGFMDRMEWASETSAGAYDPTDGLTLMEGRLTALAFHPDLRIERLRAAGSATHAEYSGLWTDPEFALNALRITESVPKRWILTPSLGFTLPISGRLGAEHRIADAELRSALWRVREAEWSVWYAVGLNWGTWTAAGRKVAETGRLITTLESLVKTTEEQARAGELPRTEAALFTVELAHQRSQLLQLTGELAARELELHAQLGLAPAAPIAFLPLGIPRTREPADSGAPDWLEALAERNPSLARLEEDYEVAEEVLHREILAQIPDLTLGPVYSSDEGQSRIGLFGGVPLPLFNANAQGIADARAARELARALFETEYEELVGRCAAAEARANAHVRQRAEIEEILVPLVDCQLSEALRLLRLGESSSLVVLESLTRAHQTKLELIDVQTDEVRARAELEFLTGPPAAPSQEETP